ncbi:MAG: acyl-CoA thioesterase [Lachnospiraceae bacterium]|nr:acyl-CoA thioesterase [Lachnospiraceae bacterium]
MSVSETTQERKSKSPEDSKVEWFKAVQKGDININNGLFGGALLSWMDEVAGIAAIRHCGRTVTTAAIDNLTFKKRLVLGDLVVIEAKVTYVGNTSLEVRVDVYKEDIAKSVRYPVNRAFFTEVCIDDQGRPMRIPYDLRIETLSERADHEGAKKRIAYRKQRMKEGF